MKPLIIRVVSKVQEASAFFAMRDESVWQASMQCLDLGSVTIKRRKDAELSAGAEIAAAHTTQRISFACGTIAWKSG
jgi:hypothetical protein